MPRCTSSWVNRGLDTNVGGQEQLDVQRHGPAVRDGDQRRGPGTVQPPRPRPSSGNSNWPAATEGPTSTRSGPGRRSGRRARTAPRHAANRPTPAARWRGDNSASIVRPNELRFLGRFSRISRRCPSRCRSRFRGRAGQGALVIGRFNRRSAVMQENIDIKTLALTLTQTSDIHHTAFSVLRPLRLADKTCLLEDAFHFSPQNRRALAYTGRTRCAGNTFCMEVLSECLFSGSVFIVLWLFWQPACRRLPQRRRTTTRRPATPGPRIGFPPIPAGAKQYVVWYQ